MMSKAEFTYECNTSDYFNAMAYLRSQVYQCLARTFDLVGDSIQVLKVLSSLYASFS